MNTPLHDTSSVLVIATHNNGKLIEIRDILAPLRINVTSAGALGLAEPEETGQSFIENAVLKAVAATTASALPALADDSGLVVPALNGDPGIYSARWAGPNKDFLAASLRIAENLRAEGLEPSGTPAYFICVLALALPDGRHWHFEGRVDGTLTFPPRGDKGFGYDPIFIAHGDILTFAEIEPEQKHQISHRKQAFNKLSHWLDKNRYIVNI
jgi:XTP/dITP diphosphohydrolase